MAYTRPKITWISADLLILFAALSAHALYLIGTTFVDWPEMLLYPWFIREGLVPYRDFSMPFPPFIPLILYPLYSLFGFVPETTRFLAYLIIAVTDILVYVFALQITHRRASALLSLLFFIFWQPILYGNTLWHETVIAPVLLVLIMCIRAYHTRQSLGWAMIVSCVVAALSLMKQTVIWPVSILMLWMIFGSSDRIRAVIHAAFVPMVVVLAHGLTYLVASGLGAGSQYLFWVYLFPLSLSDSASLYAITPSRSDMVMIVPAFLPALSVFLRIRNVQIIRWLALAAAAGCMMAVPRWGIFRLSPALACMALLVGISAESLNRKRAYRSAVGMIVIAVACVLSLRSFRIYTYVRDPMQPQFFESKYSEILNYVKETSQGSLYILGNYDYLYYGLGRKPDVLPWIPMFPWNARMPGFQQDVIRALESARVDAVLYMPYHGNDGYYFSYRPEEILSYIDREYDAVGALPVPGGVLYRRRYADR